MLSAVTPPRVGLRTLSVAAPVIVVPPNVSVAVPLVTFGPPLTVKVYPPPNVVAPMAWATPAPEAAGSTHTMPLAVAALSKPVKVVAPALRSRVFVPLPPKVVVVVIGPRAPATVATKVPPLSAMPPVNVLAPESVATPVKPEGNVIVGVPVEPMMPVTVKFPGPVTVRL